MQADIGTILAQAGVESYFAAAAGDEASVVSAGGDALGTSLEAASSIAATLGATGFGSLLELYALGETLTAVGFHLVVDPTSGQEQFVGFTTRRETDAEALVATIQAAALA